MLPSTRDIRGVVSSPVVERRHFCRNRDRSVGFVRRGGVRASFPRILRLVGRADDCSSRRDRRVDTRGRTSAARARLAVAGGRRAGERDHRRPRASNAISIRSDGSTPGPNRAADTIVSLTRSPLSSSRTRRPYSHHGRSLPPRDRKTEHSPRCERSRSRSTAKVDREGRRSPGRCPPGCRGGDRDAPLARVGGMDAHG